jgi:acyl-coenzyme A synthetase/AMP-(fatty) acid ligase
MSTKEPLIGHGDLRRAIAWRKGVCVTAGRFIAEAERLAVTLPPSADLLNLCEDRYRFMLGFAAALRAGRTTILPPNRTEQMLARMADAHPGCTAVADAPIDAAPFPITVFSEAAAAGPEATQVALVAGDHVAAIAYTSGSTGDPQPSPKRWDKLVAGAFAEQVALGLPPGVAHNFVGTVPAQHMYGLESTVVLPMATGGAIHPARPLLALDVQRALEAVPAPRVLVTTPVHIRACLASRVDLPSLALLVSAAAPLAPEVAKQAAERFRTRIVEIYGCSEAGMVAARNPVGSPPFRTMGGIRIEREGEGWSFTGGHVPDRVPVPDLIRALSETEFVLSGRASDMINVAGKRASLGDLNHKLLEIAGVRDGTFYAPDSPDQVARLMAFVVAPGLTPTHILAELRRSIDPAFLPRPLVLVERLPRAATGKLPLEAMRALAAAVDHGVAATAPDVRSSCDGR